MGRALAALAFYTHSFYTSHDYKIILMIVKYGLVTANRAKW